MISIGFLSFSCDFHSFPLIFIGFSSFSYEFHGFSLISISIPLHEVQFPLENTYGTLLKANAQRMVGKFMIRPVGNAAVIELSHKILYDEFNQEDFLAAFGTLAMEGPKWLT